MSKSLKIVLIGAGNVAGFLGEALKKNHCSISKVYSRTHSSANKLAKKLGAKACTEISKLDSDADVYLMAVKDDAISDLLNQIQFQPQLILHTSGSVSLEVFSKKFKNCGVLYPLQTFSAGKTLDLSEVPFFVEANSKSNLTKIKTLALLLTKKIIPANSEKRKAIHVAAVFACNFTNHMYAIAESLLAKEKIPFSVLYPLIEETARKAESGSPKKLQTGPAIRRDSKVIKSHLGYLKNSKDFKKIYTLVSKSISDLSSKNGEK